MERCVTELGLHGIEIGTHVNDWNLDHPALFPVFEAAERLGAAVFVHLYLPSFQRPSTFPHGLNQPNW